MPASAANRRRARPYTELQIFKRFAFLIVLRYPAEPAVSNRSALRERLHGVRDRFAAESGNEASIALAAHLSEVLAELMPERLGLYWPLRSEFNAASACLGDKSLDDLALALPFAAKSPIQMHYRVWNRVPPTGRDECGIPSPDGAPVAIPMAPSGSSSAPSGSSAASGGPPAPAALHAGTGRCDHAGAQSRTGGMR